MVVNRDMRSVGYLVQCPEQDAPLRANGRGGSPSLRGAVEGEDEERYRKEEEEYRKEREREEDAPSAPTN